LSTAQRVGGGIVFESRGDNTFSALMVLLLDLWDWLRGCYRLWKDRFYFPLLTCANRRCCLLSNLFLFNDL